MLSSSHSVHVQCVYVAIRDVYSQLDMYATVRDARADQRRQGRADQAVKGTRLRLKGGMPYARIASGNSYVVSCLLNKRKVLAYLCFKMCRSSSARENHSGFRQVHSAIRIWGWFAREFLDINCYKILLGWNQRFRRLVSSDDNMMCQRCGIFRGSFVCNPRQRYEVPSQSCDGGIVDSHLTHKIPADN
jgi:hypothetical protein